MKKYEKVVIHSEPLDEDVESDEIPIVEAVIMEQSEIKLSDNE